MSKHTALPWRAEGRIIHGSDSPHTNGRERNALGYSSASYSDRVCEIYGDMALEAPAANMEFIVRAVNSHDDLLKACKLINGPGVDAMEDKFKVGRYIYITNEELQTIRSAIAAAEPQKG